MRPDKNEDFPQVATSSVGDRPWWQKPYRMVQTNLRQTDAALDPKAVARQTRDFGADILLFNIGGIYAFYPTDLELHERNPISAATCSARCWRRRGGGAEAGRPLRHVEGDAPGL